ncbi:MAG: hypothetical protein IPJ68_05250 [Candidatus Moraniibacteriota bacterium]|nr:MAG: hypothetical protein IPJ68_05250 [Candidatus Moranbacteria bacterium]
MRGVKKNTQKIFASLFLSVLVFQGVLGCAASVHANQTIQTPVEAATVGGATNAGVKEGQGIATGDVSTGCNIGNITGCLKDFSLWLLNLIRSAIILIIASPAAALFVWVVNPANVSGPNGILNFPAVYTLWQFIRDFFNLFFIFILLFSAFATIFQVDSFNIRNIFKNILLTALLINFSFPITRFLIDVANVPMYYFINDVIGAGGGQGAVIAMNNLLGFSGTAAAALTTDYIPTFAAIIFAFLFGISLAVLSVMLIVRLIALTLLLVFSPIGFAGSLLPGFNKYGQEWWSKFWSYAFFGPAAALMLVVSLKFLEATQTANVWRSVDQVSTNASVSASGSTLITNVIFYTIPIILIWATIGLANKFAIAGSAAVVGMGYGAAHWARKKVQGAAMAPVRLVGKGAAGTAKYAGRKIETKLAASDKKWVKYLSPTVLKSAFKQRSEAQHHEDQLPIDMAKARMHDELNKAFSSIPIVNKFTHADSTNYAFLEQNKQKAHYEAEIKEQGGGEVNENVVRRALKEGYEERNSAKVLAASTLLSRINGLDNVAADFAHELGTASIDPVTGLVDITESYKDTMKKILEDVGVDEQAIMKHMHNFGENAKMKGDIAFGDFYEPDVATGTWTGTSDHAGTVAGNFKKMKAQTRQDVLHARGLFTQVVDPASGNRKYGDMHASGLAVAMEINNNDVGSASRTNAVVQSAILDAYEGAVNTATSGNYRNFKAAYNTNPMFREYVEKTVKPTLPSGHTMPTRLI